MCQNCQVLDLDNSLKPFSTKIPTVITNVCSVCVVDSWQGAVPTVVPVQYTTPYTGAVPSLRTVRQNDRVVVQGKQPHVNVRWSDSFHIFNPT